MKIFVTVGTTPFDSLIEFCDQELFSLFTLDLQIATGRYSPINCNWFRFDNDINKWYEMSDLVVTHGGAGTILKLLRSNKDFIVVPNTDRLDDHQLDFCHFISDRKFAPVSFDYTASLLNLIMSYYDFEKSVYDEPTFFLHEELEKTIRDALR